MQKNIAKLMGVMVAGLAVSHLFARDERVFKMTVDRSLTSARIPIALSLLHAGFIAKTNKTARTTLTSVGLTYIGMGVTALVDPKLGGTAPKGFSNQDIAFHLITGTGAVLAGLIPAAGKKSSS